VQRIRIASSLVLSVLGGGGLWPVWVCCSVKTGAGSSLLEWMTGRHRMRRREVLADETKSWDSICRVGGGARV